MRTLGGLGRFYCLQLHATKWLYAMLVRRMKITSAEREGKQLVVRTEPPLTPEQFSTFKTLMIERGLQDSSYTEDGGAIIITDPWPFEQQKNMDALETTIRAAVEAVKRKA